MGENGFHTGRVVGALVEGGVDDPQVRPVEAVQECDRSIEFGDQVVALGLVADGGHLDPDRLGPLGVPLVHSGETTGDLLDSSPQRVIPVRSGDRQRVEDVEVDGDLHNATRIPVEWHR